MHINLINLDRSPDRLAQFRSLNEHLKDVSRFRAVDGKTLDIEALLRDRLIHADVLPAYTVGALGCAMSHLALWQRAITSNEPVTIAEDDAIFNSGFDEDADTLLQEIDPEWDLILWGWNFSHPILFDAMPGVSSCVAHFDEGAMRRGAAIFRDQIVSPRLFRLYRAFGTPCYSVSPKGAKALWDKLVPLRDGSVLFPGSGKPYRITGIDVAMNGAYDALRAYVSMPPLVITRNERSTTQGREMAKRNPAR